MKLFMICNLPIVDVKTICDCWDDKIDENSLQGFYRSKDCAIDRAIKVVRSVGCTSWAYENNKFSNQKEREEEFSRLIKYMREIYIHDLSEPEVSTGLSIRDYYKGNKDKLDNFLKEKIVDYYAGRNNWYYKELHAYLFLNNRVSELTVDNFLDKKFIVKCFLEMITSSEDLVEVALNERDPNILQMIIDRSDFLKGEGLHEA